MNYSSELLNLFAKPRAKFDYITVALPPQWMHNQAPARRLENALDGRIAIPHRWRDHRDDHFTIHDPTINDLLLVSEILPEMPILALELSLDFYLADGSNDREALEQMHRWLVMSLTPQRAGLLKPNMCRFRYDETDKTIRRDSMRTGINGNQGRTVYWQDSNQQIKVRCYIKTHDNYQPLLRHCVRLEVSLSRGGCQVFEASHGKYIPAMLAGLRKSFFRLMSVGRGIKPCLTRCRTTNPAKATAHQEKQDQERRKAALAWNTYGALWAHQHNRETIPDAEANRLIGAALNDLQREARRKNCHKKEGNHADDHLPPSIENKHLAMSPPVSYRVFNHSTPSILTHARMPGSLRSPLKARGSKETESYKARIPRSAMSGSLRSPGARQRGKLKNTEQSIDLNSKTNGILN